MSFNVNVFSIENIIYCLSPYYAIVKDQSYLLPVKVYPVPNFVPEDKEAIIRILSPSILSVTIFI